MRFVLTNDDGIDAPGLRALETLVRSLNGARVVLAAPERPQSGVGHRVTTKEPIHVEEIEPYRFRVAGTPADCARLALRELAPDTEWLISGINRGGNLGADVYTSGTVAAAREAALLGCKAVALSQYVAEGREVDWDLTVARALPVLARLLEEPLAEGSFWNVNLPHPEGAETDLEVVFCALDPSPLDVRYRRDGRAFYYAGHYHSRRRVPGRDVDVCLGGRIAVTRLPLDLEC